MDTLKRLAGMRRGMLALNLIYFLLLLAVGAAVFLWQIPYGWVAVPVCLALYLLLIRPYTSRYRQAVRTAILTETIGRQLTDFQYVPDAGVSQETVERSGVASATLAAFRSREHITGQSGEFHVELADVTFPIRENDLNAMCNGCFVSLCCPNTGFPLLHIDHGELAQLQLPKRQLELLKKMDELIPGGLYLHREGDRLSVLLRGRFLGFRVEPMLPVTAERITKNPLPEFDAILEFAGLQRSR